MRLDNVILYVLYAGYPQPVHGRVGITCQVFVATDEIFDLDKHQDPKFMPSSKGPYSFLIEHIIDNLEYDGLISIKGTRNTSTEKIHLTEKGVQYTKKRFNKLPKKLQRILVDRRRGWDQNHITGMISYIDNKYPNYTSNITYTRNQLKTLWLKKYKKDVFI